VTRPYEYIGLTSALTLLSCKPDGDIGCCFALLGGSIKSENAQLGYGRRPSDILLHGVQFCACMISAKQTLPCINA